MFKNEGQVIWHLFTDQCIESLVYIIIKFKKIIKPSKPKQTKIKMSVQQPNEILIFMYFSDMAL